MGGLVQFQTPWSKLGGVITTVIASVKQISYVGTLRVILFICAVQASKTLSD